MTQKATAKANAGDTLPYMVADAPTAMLSLSFIVQHMNQIPDYPKTLAACLTTDLNYLALTLLKDNAAPPSVMTMQGAAPVTMSKSDAQSRLSDYRSLLSKVNQPQAADPAKALPSWLKPLLEMGIQWLENWLATQ